MLWSESVNQQLRYISQRAMQRAAEMFSRLLKQPVTIEVQDAWLIDKDSPVLLPQTAGIGVKLDVSGDIGGQLLLFLGEDSARWLAEQLLGQPVPGDLLSEPSHSTLREIGNIVASAFLASFDDQLGLRSLPSPPTLASGYLGELVDAHQSATSGPGLVIRTKVHTGQQESAGFCGESYLFCSSSNLKGLLRRLA